MKVGIVGSGGREHALAVKLMENKTIEKLYCFPGNGAMGELGENVGIGAMDLDGIAAFAKDHHIDFMVVAPDDPLAAGLVDLLEEAGIAAFGPTKAAARLEASKVFAKEFMQANHIPTASWQVFDSYDEALCYLKTGEYPLVVKADGLALGKGVVVANTFSEAQAALEMMMKEKRFGESAKRVLIEECLTGPEVSLLCFTDANTAVPMIASMDHKRIFDGDLGPNTGGMGVVAPNPFFTPAMQRLTMERIVYPTLKGLKALGTPFRGCLYFGLMLTEKGPMVIEYNARFGDPETQAVLPLLQSDLFTIMLHCANDTLCAEDVSFSDEACCCVVMASKGYPGKYETGKKIDFSGFTASDCVRVYHAGTKKTPEGYVTNGGRVLCVSAVAPVLSLAVEKAYAGVRSIHFEGSVWRTDIGKRALEQQKKEEADA